MVNKTDKIVVRFIALKDDPDHMFATTVMNLKEVAELKKVMKELSEALEESVTITNESIIFESGRGLSFTYISNKEYLILVKLNLVNAGVSNFVSIENHKQAIIDIKREQNSI